MRATLVLLHRWAGLFMAVFLFISGLTGAVISWDHELDEWLNPGLFDAMPASRDDAIRTPLALANQLEASDPRLQITYMPLALEPGHALSLFVHEKPGSDELDFNQMAVNPVSGDVQQQRMWGAVSLTRENLLPFLYKLHYSMHIPDGFGLELGVLFMGIVAIVWVLDSLIALWISFPSIAAWRKSFAFRWRAGGYRLTFDLHRSGGVWVWLLLLILAVTSVSMNLEHQLVRPLVNAISPLTPSPFSGRALAEHVLPGKTREDILERAQSEAVKYGITDEAGGIFYSPEFDVYGVGFFAAGKDHGEAGLGNPWLYFDGHSGEPVGADVPGQGSAGDLFMQLQFPLHSGRIIGLPGRIMVSLMGLLVAMLSLTGIIIWAKKRRARQRSVQRVQQSAQAAAPADGVPQAR